LIFTNHGVALFDAINDIFNKLNLQQRQWWQLEELQWPLLQVGKTASQISKRQIKRSEANKMAMMAKSYFVKSERCLVATIGNTRENGGRLDSRNAAAPNDLYFLSIVQ
jgi:hypothetical protein